MEQIIKKSLQSSYTYNQYRELLKQQIANNADVTNDVLLEYIRLNDKRMDRLDKTISLSNETVELLTSLQSELTFLVLSEGWCGDAAQIVPVINKIAEATSSINLKIVFRDENDELMSQFLTNGSKSIPKVIVLNNKNEVLNSWGPRPSVATKMVEEYKEVHGKLDEEFKKNLQLWYNKDKGYSTQEDIIKLLKAS